MVSKYVRKSRAISHESKYVIDISIPRRAEGDKALGQQTTYISFAMIDPDS